MLFVGGSGTRENVCVGLCVCVARGGRSLSCCVCLCLCIYGMCTIYAQTACSTVPSSKTGVHLLDARVHITHATRAILRAPTPHRPTHKKERRTHARNAG